jgi:hypothetical protein
MIPIYVFPAMKLVFPKQNYTRIRLLILLQEILGPILAIYKSFTDT